MAGCSIGGILSFSSDSGENWNNPSAPPDPEQNYQAYITSSADGKRMALAGGRIATSRAPSGPYFINVNSNSGPYTGSGITSNFSPGAADESAQALASFIVTNDNGSLFNVQPAIANDGTLTFTPSTAFGTAEVTVIAQDNGGTDNGGVATSEPKTFTINVLPLSNANLSSLLLSSGAFAPAFATATTSYSTTVDNGVTSLTVTPTVEQVSATLQVKVNAGSFGGASAPLPLNLGNNTVAILVTAQDGIAKKTYTLTVNRQLSLPSSADITASSVTFGANVSSDTGLAITERGILYARTAINANPLVGGTGVTRVIAGGASGAFALPVGSLLPGTSYSFRAYANNNSYSPVLTLMTFTAQPRIEVNDPNGDALADNATLPFGDAATGATKIRTLVIRNTGIAPLTGIAATLGGSNAADFALGNLPVTTLQPGASMSLPVSFKPTAVAGSSATLNIASNDSGLSIHRTLLTGNGIAPSPAVLAVQREMPTTVLTDNGSAVDFGNAVLGTDKTITFTVRNIGSQNLTGIALTTFGTNAADFILGPLTTPTLGAADTTTFTVALRPSVTGVRTATVRIASSDTTKQPFFRINVTGTGTAPEIDIAQGTTAMADGKNSVSFGTTVAVGTPMVKTFTITNSGTADLELTSAVIDGVNASEFVLGMPGSTALAQAASTTFDVTFTPTAFGARSAALHILSNDGNESPYDINLTGTAVGSEISVQQPVNVQLSNNTSIVGFGPVISTTSAARTFTLRNLGNAPLSGIGVSSDSAQFVVATTPLIPSTLAANASTTFTVNFTPNALTDFAANLSISSNDHDEGTFKIALTGKGIAAAAPTISADPQSQLIALGQPVTFGATVMSPVAFTRQWRRGTGSTFTNISGATAATYTIPAVKLTDAALLYRLRATNATGGLFAESATATLTVVDRKATAANLAAGKTATFTIAAASSSALTYLWKKNGGALPTDDRYVGGDSNTLTISTLTAGDAGTYTCDVSGQGGTLAGGNNVLTVFADAPVIMPSPLVMDPAIVSGDYSFFIPLDPDHGSATSFTCTTPPAGLKFNTATGELSGKPTVSRPTAYVLTVTAMNDKGTATAAASLLISPLTPEAAGTYVGIIERGPVTDDLGGRIDLTISSTGSYTGKVTLGASKAVSFPVGSITASLNTSNVTGNVVVPRAPLPPVSIDFVIDTQTKRFTITDCTVTVGTDSRPFDGWRNVWSSTTQATSYKGLYNFALDVPASSHADLSIPQGLGYGSFTVPAKGELFAIAGKLADGDGYTSSAFLGPDGDLAVYVALPSKGSLVGTMQINLGTGPAFNDNVLTAGTLTWSRPASTDPKASTYKAGFDTIPLNAEGGRYIAPVTPAIVMNKIAGANNATLAFFDANIGGPRSCADRKVTLTAGASLTIAAAGPTLTSLKIITGTGVFSGGFTLVNNHPFLSGAATIKRTVTFQGLIIPTVTGPRGQGYFLLQQLPSNVFPAPATLSILSGAVVIE